MSNQVFETSSQALEVVLADVKACRETDMSTESASSWLNGQSVAYTRVLSEFAGRRWHAMNHLAGGFLMASVLLEELADYEKVITTLEGAIGNTPAADYSPQMGRRVHEA